MKYVFAQLMFTGFILALYFIIQVLRKREMKYKENRLFVIVCIFSAIWSFGFFGVILQTDSGNAYLWRAIGLVGTFGFLIAAQFLICHLSDVKKIYCYLTEGFSLLGIIIYFFIIQKDQVTYELTNIGMTYSFHPGLSNNLYILYSVLVAFNQFGLIGYMIKKPRAQRLKELGKKLLIVEFVMILGMLLDTVFPLFGQPAIPGSTIGQFVALVVMYHSLSFFNLSRITISNMSEFIYYSLTVPVMVFDSKEKLQILNDTAFPFLGVNRERMAEVSIDKLFDITSEEIFQFDTSSQSVDTVCVHNEKYCSLSVNKIFDNYGDKIGYIIIVADLSEKMRSMKRLEEAMKEAEYASQAKSVFLANMSHEIRTPMNAIIGFSELLLKMNIGEDVRSHVEDIKLSSNNLLAIINDILDISKIESGKMELVRDNYYMANLLNDVALIVNSQAERKGLHFEMKVDETIPRELYGDNVRIRSILINLLNNGVKYTDEGSITFEVFTISKDERKIKLAFRVTDTGTGIKEENLSTLFDHFERFDQKVHYGVEGSGLGLAIAKGYITLMGGEIKVSSRYGEGSVFTVEVEQEIVDSAPMKKEYTHGREALGDGKADNFTIKDVRVLVVDDNPVNLKVAQGILRTYGLEVDTALNGTEAIELCKEQQYQIVFMDQMMPGMDGLEAMLQIRQLNDYYKAGGEGKIIVLTANAIKGTREMLIGQGFDEYLGKPLNINRLARLLCRFIPDEKIIFEKRDQASSESGDLAEVNYIKEALPELDVDLGMSHCGGQVEDYLKVLEITYKYGEKQLDELKCLWEEKDYKTYSIKVHSLKSTSLNIGAREISAEAKKQEMAGIEGDYAYIEKNIETLMTGYMEILNKIKEVLLHFGVITTEMEEEERLEDKSQLDDRMVANMLRNIEEHLNDFDFAKVFNILEEIKKYQVPQKYEEVLQQVEKLMEDLSVDKIKNLLKEVEA